MDGVEWLDEREERAWRALQFMQLRLTAELARRLGDDSRLSYADYVVLVALTGEPGGRMRPYELARSLGWEQSRLSHHISRMARRGLVAKFRSVDDGRGAVVAVTDTGRLEIAAAAPGHVAAVRELFMDHVDGDELDVIHGVAERVLGQLDRPGG